MMKNGVNLNGIVAILFFSISIAQADTYRKYDLCNGSLPAGGFSNEKKSYTVSASEEGSMIIIHMNGTSDGLDFRFNSTFNQDQDQDQDQQQRIYKSVSQFEYAQLNILCKNLSDNYCPAELITNISGSKQTYKLNCEIDKIDYPSPRNPNHCQQHCL